MLLRRTTKRRLLWANEFYAHASKFAADTTGLESVYTVYEGHEIMFHVSTLLPYTPDNKQQVVDAPSRENEAVVVCKV